MRTKAWWGEVPVTQLFGENPSFYSKWGLAGHNGVDFGHGLWHEVVAFGRWVVTEVGEDPAGYGYYVKLAEAAGGEWLYAHLQKEGRPLVGASLESGWTVGFTGTSGASSGPHLHLAYRPDARYRASAFGGWENPLPYLPRETEPA
jgi:murein DD-endopeptidase MepM/ murein hydrolase activator NlpD